MLHSEDHFREQHAAHQHDAGTLSTKFSQISSRRRSSTWVMRKTSTTSGSRSTKQPSKKEGWYHAASKETKDGKQFTLRMSSPWTRTQTRSTKVIGKDTSPEETLCAIRNQVRHARWHLTPNQDEIDDFDTDGDIGSKKKTNVNATRRKIGKYCSVPRPIPALGVNSVGTNDAHRTSFFFTVFLSCEVQVRFQRPASKSLWTAYSPTVLTRTRFDAHNNSCIPQQFQLVTQFPLKSWSTLIERSFVRGFVKIAFCFIPRLLDTLRRTHGSMRD